jgi:hypothetical protein
MHQIWLSGMEVLILVVQERTISQHAWGLPNSHPFSAADYFSLGSTVLAMARYDRCIIRFNFYVIKAMAQLICQHGGIFATNSWLSNTVIEKQNETFIVALMCSKGWTGSRIPSDPLYREIGTNLSQSLVGNTDIWDGCDLRPKKEVKQYERLFNQSIEKLYYPARGSTC